MRLTGALRAAGPTRAERYALTRHAGSSMLVAAVCAALVAALSATLPAVASSAPAPWLAVGPVATVGACWAVRRLRRRGEDLALGIAAVRPLRLGLTAGLWVLAVTLAVATLPGDRGPGPRGDGARDSAQVDVHGALLLRGGDGTGYLWAADARWPTRTALAPGAVPAGFVAVPRHVGRFRLQLFASGSPLAPTPHPLDPTGWRWAWAVAFAGLAGLALACAVPGPRLRVPRWARARAQAGSRRSTSAG
ncbi:MAG: hypothetical protein IPM29_12745 [Planctomycetes bacterium]|nr:hypothetical protein [Planctomycetota bacterium]